MQFHQLGSEYESCRAAFLSGKLYNVRITIKLWTCHMKMDLNKCRDTVMKVILIGGGAC